MSSETEAVGSEEVRVLVEMGDNYQPSARLAAAINELADALQAEGDDVAGFGKADLKMRNFSFTGGLEANVESFRTGRRDGLKWCKLDGGQTLKA